MSDFDPKAMYQVSGAELLELRRLALSLRNRQETSTLLRACDVVMGLVVGLCVAALLLL